MGAFFSTLNNLHYMIEQPPKGITMCPEDDKDTLLASILIAAVCLGWLLFAPKASAEADVWLSASVASYHTDRSKDYNESNPGIGLEVSKGNHAAGLGTYENSYYQQTVYLTYSYRPMHLGKVSVGGFVGLATGYESPFIGGAVVSYEGKRFGGNLLIVPPVEDRSGVIGLQLKWRL